MWWFSTLEKFSMYNYIRHNAFHGTWPKSPCISRLIRRASISLLRDGHHQDQAYHFGKKDFELGVKGQDTSRNLKGSFVSIRVLLHMWGLGANTKIWLKGIELSYFNHSMFSKNVKIGLKMTVMPLCPINVLAQKWHLTYFVPIDGQMFWDMNFKFVFPSIYIRFDIQTKFEVDQTKTGHSILQKLTIGHISEPILTSVNHHKAYFSYIFRFICWIVQNQCKYGFCTY